MPRLRNLSTQVVVNVDDDTAARLVSEGWKAADEPTGGYEAMKVADLRAEIARRNEGRDEADRLPDDGRKADLIAALEADDE
jgi:hypothetical protein